MRSGQTIQIKTKGYKYLRILSRVARSGRPVALVAARPAGCRGCHGILWTKRDRKTRQHTLQNMNTYDDWIVVNSTCCWI